MMTNHRLFLALPKKKFFVRKLLSRIALLTYSIESSQLWNRVTVKNESIGFYFVLEKGNKELSNHSQNTLNLFL